MRLLRLMPLSPLLPLAFTPLTFEAATVNVAGKGTVVAAAVAFSKPAAVASCEPDAVASCEPAAVASCEPDAVASCEPVAVDFDATVNDAVLVVVMVDEDTGMPLRITLTRTLWTPAGKPDKLERLALPRVSGAVRLRRNSCPACSFLTTSSSLSKRARTSAFTPGAGTRTVVAISPHWQYSDV